MRLALFGSAFNPPTLGHADAIAYLLACQPAFDQILLLPSFAHAFGKEMLDYNHRLAMLELFIRDLANEKVKILAIEHQLQQPGKAVYTYDVLAYLQAEVYPDDELVFCMGPDNQANWHKFYRSDEIDQNWQKLVVPERIQVRSSLVREMVKNGSDTRDMLTPGVHSYIQKHSLYC